MTRERLDPEPKRAERTILVADDSDTYRSIAARVLADAGYRVEEARDGAAAVARVLEPGSPIDLLVFELELPKVRGIDVLRRIRERVPNAPIKTLAVGEVFSEHVRRVLRELRIDASLNKNHALRELLYHADALLFPSVAEQRRSQRHLRHMPVNYWVGDEIYLESCFDVSEIGMFVAVADVAPPPVGAGLALRFWLPIADRLVVCEGEVVWLNAPVGDLRLSHPPGMGIRFTAIAAEDVQLIRRFLETTA